MMNHFWHLCLLVRYNYNTDPYSRFRGITREPTREFYSTLTSSLFRYQRRSSNKIICLLILINSELIFPFLSPHHICSPLSPSSRPYGIRCSNGAKKNVLNIFTFERRRRQRGNGAIHC